MLFGYFNGRFEGHPLTTTNMDEMIFEENGDVLLRETRGIGPGLLISKARADQMIGESMISAMKEIYEEIKETQPFVEDLETRSSPTPKQQSKRKLQRVSDQSSAKKQAVESSLEKERTEKESLAAKGRFPCLVENGKCFCTKDFSDATRLRNHSIKSDHKFPVQQSLDDRTKMMVHNMDRRERGQMTSGRGEIDLSTTDHSIESNEKDIRASFSLSLSDDATQTIGHLLLHRLKSRQVFTDQIANSTSVRVQSKTDGAAVYNSEFSRWVLRFIHLVDGGPRYCESTVSISGDGKTALDCLFGEIGFKARRFLNAGNDTSNASEYHDAFVGIPGVHTSVLDVHTSIAQPVVDGLRSLNECLKNSPKRTQAIKVQDNLMAGVRSTHGTRSSPSCAVVPASNTFDAQSVNIHGLSAEDEAEFMSMGSYLDAPIKNESWTPSALAFVRNIWEQGERTGNKVPPPTVFQRMQDERHNNSRVFGPCCVDAQGNSNPLKSMEAIKGKFSQWCKERKNLSAVSSGNCDISKLKDIKEVKLCGKNACQKLKAAGYGTVREFASLKTQGADTYDEDKVRGLATATNHTVLVIKGWLDAVHSLLQPLVASSLSGVRVPTTSPVSLSSSTPAPSSSLT